MGIEVSLTLSKDSINLGETVTATYSCKGAYDTLIWSDNMPNQLDLGPGDQVGTMKFLPTWSGTYTITIFGNGDISKSDASASEFTTATVNVN